MIDAQPDRLNPFVDDVGFEGPLETAAQPPLFGGSTGVLSTLTGSEGVEAGVTLNDILTPLAAAIFRRSLSSRLRSFSWRLSISSWSFIRLLACTSLMRAL